LYLEPLPNKQGDRVVVRVKKTDEAAEDAAAVAVADMDSDDEGEEMLVETGPKSGGSEDDDGGGLVAGDTSGVDIEMEIICHPILRKSLVEHAGKIAFVSF
jgi:hypothetical protein